jgi:hypothetical protein
VVAVSFQIDRIEGLDSFLVLSNPKLYQKAIRDGLKYAGRAAKTQLAKEVGARFSLKAARIKDDIKGPFINVQEGALEFRLARRPPTALAYGGRQVAKGLSVAYLKGSRRVIPNAFVRKRKGGSVDLPFYRNRRSGKINVLHGPSIGAIIKGKQGQFSKQIINDSTNRAFEQWVKGVRRTIEADARRASGSTSARG